jgi:hypothetical protein
MAAKVTSAGEYASNLLKLIFQAVNYPGFADNTVTAPFTSLYVSLHTADPGPGGNQATSEAAYGGYARVAVVRTASGWVVTGNSVSPVAPITFPQASTGSETETYAGIGTSATGAGHLLYRAPISPSIAVSAGVQPQLTTGSAWSEI